MRLHRVPAQVTITTAWIDHTKLLIAAPPNAPALDVQVLNEGEGGEGEATGRGRVLSISDAKMLLPPDALKYLDGMYALHLWSRFTVANPTHTSFLHPPSLPSLLPSRPLPHSRHHSRKGAYVAGPSLTISGYYHTHPED